jgi:TrmH family RNA methyltransferase
MERITSRQNAVVKRVRELARSSGMAPTGEILLDGEHLVQEALAHSIPIEIAAFSERQTTRPGAPLRGLADEVRSRGGRVLLVTDLVLAAMSPVEHPSGVVAIARTRTSTLAEAVSGTTGSDPDLKKWTGGSGSGPAPLAVVLAGVQDPGNVGAIVRTAAACGATGVVTTKATANPFGWKALRGAMGGTFSVPVATRASLADVIAAARHARVRLMAAVPRDGTPLPATDLRGPAAILLGGEGAGLSQTAATAAAERITIPMRPPIESLNVAVAAALILYEASRQRREAQA